MKRTDGWWIAGAVGCVAAVLILLFLFFPSASGPTTRSAAPQGLKGVYRLLEERGEHPGRWEKEWEALPESSGDVLFIIRPGGGPVSPSQQRHLFRWVERGNTAVLWAKPQDVLAREWGWTLRSEGKGAVTVPVDSLSGKWLRDIRALSLSGDDVVEPGSRGKVFLTDTRGAGRVGLQIRGRGRVFVVADAGMLTNAFIRKEDNLALVLYFASLAKGRVWFDEGDHGSVFPEIGGSGEQPPTSVTDLISPDGFYPLMAGFIAFLSFLYWHGKRFSAPRRAPGVHPRSSVEYVDAMAGLYQRAGIGGDVLRLQLRQWLRKAARMWGLPPWASEEELLTRIRQTAGEEPAGKAAGLIREIHRTGPEIRGRELIRLSRSLEETGEEMKQWKKMKSTP